MALPLPNILPDIGPGGGIVNALRGLQSLKGDILGNQIKNIEMQYAPLTKKAEAASKLAYANLMGPQFLSKLLGNNAILANLPDSKKAEALNMLYKAGSGGATGNSIGINPLSALGKSEPSEENLSSWLVNKFKSMVGNNNQEEASSPNALLNAQPNLSAFDEKNINNMQPGEAYRVQGNKSVPSPFSATMPAPQGNPATFSENLANYEGVVEEGKEAGKIRAKNIEELNNTVFNGETNQATLDNISEILGSPVFENIRSVPLAGHHELAYYSKFGTPEQQNMVGQYYTLTGNIIKDASRDFAGQFRRGEQQLLQNMKPSAADTVDTARGKTEALSYINKLLTERSRLTAKLMNEYHINKGQAQEIADKRINGAALREQIHNKLNPVRKDKFGNARYQNEKMNENEELAPSNLNVKNADEVITIKGMRHFRKGNKWYYEDGT